MPKLSNFDKLAKVDIDSGTRLYSFWKTDKKLGSTLPHWCAYCGNRSREKENYCSYCGRRMIAEADYERWAKGK